jgi:hypothetical protein
MINGATGEKTALYIECIALLAYVAMTDRSYRLWAGSSVNFVSLLLEPGTVFVFANSSLMLLHLPGFVNLLMADLLAHRLPKCYSYFGFGKATRFRLVAGTIWNLSLDRPAISGQPHHTARSYALNPALGQTKAAFRVEFVRANPLRIASKSYTQPDTKMLIFCY